MLKLSIYSLAVIAFSVRHGEPKAFPPPLETGEIVRVPNIEDNNIKTPPSPHQESEPKEAYVTLNYGGSLLGTRVLGQSLRETETKKDLVALCTEKVSDADKNILKADGWIIRSVNEWKSSLCDYSPGVYSKLHVWNMTEYDRIVYLDSDVLVRFNIDCLFDCGTFCATFQQSDAFFNSGVMVIEPSKAVFTDMLKQFRSYNQAGQGFLNEYFKDLVYASYFNWRENKRQQQPMRMPFIFNADPGNYYISPLLQSSIPYNIHYSGPIKPWLWWTNFLSDLNWQWTNVRKRLPKYPDHKDSYQPIYLPLFWAPYPILVLLYAGVKFSEYCSNKIALVPRSFFSYSHYLPLPLLFLSYYLANRFIVPATMMPSQAAYVFLLWANFFLLIFVGFYCYLWRVTEKHHKSNRPNIPQKKLRLMFVLWILFITSSITLFTVPTKCAQFTHQIKTLLSLLGIHLVISQITGCFLMNIFTPVSQ